MDEKNHEIKSTKGIRKSLYILISILVAVIGSICFLLAAVLYLISSFVEMIRNIFCGRKEGRKEDTV